MTVRYDTLEKTQVATPQEMIFTVISVTLVPHLSSLKWKQPGSVPGQCQKV